MNSPLSFQEGFEIDTNWNFDILKIDFLKCQLKIHFEANSNTNWNKHFLFETNTWYQYEKYTKILKWWCGPFALGLILSPPLALIAKNGEFESPLAFLPLWGLILSQMVK
jgi:hypothetical protein